MRCSGLAGSIILALLFAGLVPAAAGVAMPMAGRAGMAEAAGPPVQRAAHKHHEWHWDGYWRKSGPWADHVVNGLVVVRPGPTTVFVPWGTERLRRCAALYRSFDPATGTYLTRGGLRRVCR